MDRLFRCRFPRCPRTHTKAKFSCAGCSKNDGLQRYCSKECQLLDWDLQHSVFCERLDQPATAGQQRDRVAVQGSWFKVRDQSQVRVLKRLMNSGPGLEFAKSREDDVQRAEAVNTELEHTIGKMKGLCAQYLKKLKAGKELYDRMAKVNQELHNKMRLSYFNRTYTQDMINVVMSFVTIDRPKGWTGGAKFNELCYAKRITNPVAHWMKTGNLGSLHAYKRILADGCPKRPDRVVALLENATRAGRETRELANRFFATVPFGKCGLGGDGNWAGPLEALLGEEVVDSRAYTPEMLGMRRPNQYGALAEFEIFVRCHYLVFDFANAAYFMVERKGWADSRGDEFRCDFFEIPAPYEKLRGDVVSLVSK